MGGVARTGIRMVTCFAFEGLSQWLLGSRIDNGWSRLACLRACRLVIVLIGMGMRMGEGSLRLRLRLRWCLGRLRRRVLLLMLLLGYTKIGR